MKNTDERVAKLKVLLAPAHYVYESSVRGSEYRHAYEIADNIAKSTDNSVVITGKITEDATHSYRVIEVQPNESIYDMTTSKAIKFTLKYSVASIKVMIRERFDVVHHVRPFNVDNTFNLVALLGLTRNKIFIVGSFSYPYINDLPLNLPARIAKSILKYLSTKTLKKADCVVVYDQATKDAIKKYVAESKIEIIAPGVDGKKFHPIKKTNNNDFNIISVGYLIPRKRFDFLIKAFEPIAKKFPDAKLTIVGDGPEKSNLENLISTLGLTNSVKLAGFVPNYEVADLYKNADLFAMMQAEESFGQVYIEAMASGLPILTSINIGSKLIVNEKVGYIIDMNDAAKLELIVSDLIVNPKKLKTLSISARKEFELKYDTTVVSKKWLELYKNLVIKKQNASN